MSTGYTTKYDTNYFSESNWSDIVPSCAGEQQSPMTIESSTAIAPTQAFELQTTALGFDKFTTVLEAADKDGENVGIWALEIDTVHFGGISTINRDGESYNLVAAHIHVGQAEHVVDGQDTDACAHFIHDNGDGKYVVYEVQYLHDDDATESFPFACPAQCDNGDAFQREIDAPICSSPSFVDSQTFSSTDSLFDVVFHKPHVDVSDFYGYQGHLTTPLCDGNVFFLIYKDIIRVNNLTSGVGSCSAIMDAFPKEGVAEKNGNWRREFAAWSDLYDLALPVVESPTEASSTDEGSTDEVSTDSGSFSQIAAAGIVSIMVGMFA